MSFEYSGSYYGDSIQFPKEEFNLRLFKAITIFLLSLGLLTACGNANYKEESKAAIKTVNTTFHEKAKKPTKKSDKIHFYLPFGYEIDDTTPNNIILKNGSKTYILFVNPQESASSNVVYKTTVEQYKKLDTNEKFIDDKMFGYLTVKKLKDDMNEMTVGVGGAKITTQVKTSSLEEEAKAMTQIVHSVTYK
ncbi:hypothetical protein [Neobacillus sp. 114]|uniref:hypothetical protein n=1 Tax=Neobacillus sp. 114 TaxID=3048535 RepID=UPI0024C41630|nr:hypothetical protein [Neobacillus sp. 114]